ncbi:tRNA pseudouridine(13) synthase TruD [Isoalcanivorax indicus]|uniref:tRNA pseudouridine(13) synthase TruD n=1 Tax=Isoalcanivorax indicus TaxID=2202653 RepID=UPI001FE58514|nr:tRNA pseudouridine(13) synthase TruD [Isoalcanivorax indicus]
MSTLPRAHGGPVGQGRLRASPEDFHVSEVMAVAPDGQGEHLWLHLRKRGLNTADLALSLARLAGLPLRAVGYSGLKDRVAVTEQWFSLHLPGKPDPALDALPEGVTLLGAARHSRKLNRGTHRANRFELVIRDLEADPATLLQRLEAVAAQGVPNYFGEQRFGRHGDNFSRARDWLLGDGEAPRKPALRSLWLSAVRSELFNQVLAERVRQGCWNQLLTGDILQPDGRRGLFLADEDSDAAARLTAGEVHPTAPMPGADGMASSGACAALEAAVLAEHAPLIDALAAHRVEGARRATRLPVQDFSWQLPEEAVAGILRLGMTLPAGAFATTVLAELLTFGNT